MRDRLVVVATHGRRYRRCSFRAQRVHGRVLSDERQTALDALLDEPAALCCPITLMLLVAPAIASDGEIYERGAIRALIEKGKLSPTTLEPLRPELRGAQKQREKVLASRDDDDVACKDRRIWSRHNSE